MLEHASYYGLAATTAIARAEPPQRRRPRRPRRRALWTAVRRLRNALVPLAGQPGRTQPAAVTSGRSL